MGGPPGGGSDPACHINRCDRHQASSPVLVDFSSGGTTVADSRQSFVPGHLQRGGIATVIMQLFQFGGDILLVFLVGDTKPDSVGG